MKRNVIMGLRKVDWVDPLRQNEFLNCVISALVPRGSRFYYDHLCAISGCAFRTSFSSEGWNHGNYHVIHTPMIVEHTFDMLGYHVEVYTRGDFAHDKALIMNSIDAGRAVITLEGVVNCSEACVISGYDEDGDVLLGYSPFMYIHDDHNEPHDVTGYFRKTHWHEGFSAQGSQLHIVVIGEQTAAPDSDDILRSTLKLASTLIESECLSEGQYNGLSAHRAFADALLHREWSDSMEPYLNVMCNYKQYIDKQYAVPYLRHAGLSQLADIYARISDVCTQMGICIPQDFSAGALFYDRQRLQPYCDLLLQVCDLEAEFAHQVHSIID